MPWCFAFKQAGDGPIYVATDFEQRINDAVFPGLQGGPHNNNIAGIAVGLHEALQPEFGQYIHRVVENSKYLASRLQDLGYTVSFPFMLGSILGSLKYWESILTSRELIMKNLSYTSKSIRIRQTDSYSIFNIALTWEKPCNIRLTVRRHSIRFLSLWVDQGNDLLLGNEMRHRRLCTHWQNGTKVKEPMPQGGPHGKSFYSYLICAIYAASSCFFERKCVIAVIWVHSGDWPRFVL